MLRHCTLATCELDSSTKLPLARCSSEVTDADDLEEFGKIGIYCQLGVTAIAYPANDAGAAEALVDESVGETGALVGARDRRCTAVYGNLKGGDTALHSTDPQASAQVQCKANRQVVAIVKDTQGKNMTITLDGKDDQIMVSGLGAMLRMGRDEITFGYGDACIRIKDGMIFLVGEVCFGAQPTAPLVLAATGVPIPGVFVGT